MKYFKITLSVCAALMASVSLASATAEDVRNPLHYLSFDKLCNQETAPKTVDAENAEKIWYVKNEHIIDQMQSRYGLSIPFSKLKGSSAETELKKLVAPCYMGFQNDVEACKPETVYKTDTERFKTTEQIKFRRALLSLFKSAETGSPTKFVVIAQGWDSYIQVPVSDKLDGKVHDVEYKPRLSPYADDVLIGRFIDDNDQPPFKVACKKDSPKITKHYPINESIIKVGNPEKRVVIENTVIRDSVFDELEEALTTIGNEKDRKWLSNPHFKAKRKFLLVKSPSDFAKTKRDSAEIGITAEAGNDSTLQANAAIGFRYQWKSDDKWKKLNHEERTFTLTPFLAIDQSAVETKRLSPTAADPLNTEDTTIAFAELSAGLRFDFEQKRKENTWDDFKDNFSRRTSYVGTRRPGWRVGGIWERFTDNNNNQHGERWGLEVSPPERFVLLPGYRRPLQLLRKNTGWARRDEDREAAPLNLIQHFSTGWMLEWDAELAFDRIDYLEAPLNFDTVFEGDRRDVDEFSVVGTNIGFDVSRLSLFGHPEDTGWLSLSVDYMYRNGYEDQDFDSAEKWEVDLSFSHIDESSLSFGVEYEIGRDFKSLTEIDSVSLNLKAKY